LTPKIRPELILVVLFCLQQVTFGKKVVFIVNNPKTKNI
jgi:hypothetical protein